MIPHPALGAIKLFPSLALFYLEHKKPLLYPAFSVSIGRSHSISGHKPRIPSKKFNMYDFYASTQDVLAKAGIVYEHWCLYIGRHRASPCVMLVHVRKPTLYLLLETSKLRLKLVNSSTFTQNVSLFQVAVLTSSGGYIHSISNSQH